MAKNTPATKGAASAKGAASSKGAKTEPKPKKERFKTFKQVGQVYTLTKEMDSSITWRLLLWGGSTVVVLVALGFLFIKQPAGWIGWGLISLMSGVATAMFVLARRASKAQYKFLEGQPGQSIAALSTVRRGWYITQTPVAVNKNQDVVTRAVGRAGVVLMLENDSASGRTLLSNEVKRTQRLVGEVPVHEFIIGTGEGRTPLPKLTRSVTKLPRVITQTEARELNGRLSAIQQAPIGLPKGPLPKGARMPRGPR